MGNRHLPMISALFVAEIAAAFETSMIYAAMARLIARFGDPVMVGWLVTAYLLVAAGISAVAGRLGDIYGRRRLILILLGCTVLGSVLSASTHSFALLLIGRALQGMSAAILPLSFGILRQHLPREKVPFNIGVMVSGAGAGTASGLVLGGMIVDHLDWRWIFVASALLAAVGYALIVALVPRDTVFGRKVKLDWIGGLLFVPAIAAVLLAISKGKDWGWLDPRVLSCAIGGFLMLALWVRQSLRHADPFIDVRLFLRRDVLVANGVSALVALGTLQITLVFSLLLQSPVWTGIGLGVSATVAGLVKLPSNIFSLAGGPLSGWLMGRSGGRIATLAGGLLTTAGWALAIVFHGSPVVIAVVLCVISFGTTMLYATIPNVIVAAVPPDRTSEATGVMSVVRTACTGIGAQVVAVILATGTLRDPAGGANFPSPSAFYLAIVVITLITLAASLLALLLPVGGLRRPKAAPAPAATG